LCIVSSKFPIVRHRIEQVLRWPISQVRKLGRGKIRRQSYSCAVEAKAKELAVLKLMEQLG